MFSCHRWMSHLANRRQKSPAVVGIGNPLARPRHPDTLRRCAAVPGAPGESAAGQQIVSNVEHVIRLVMGHVELEQL